MGETTYQIIAEMEQARTDLGRDLDELEARVRRETDWRVQVRRHPWLVVGCVVIVGLIIVKLVRS